MLTATAGAVRGGRGTAPHQDGEGPHEWRERRRACGSGAVWQRQSRAKWRGQGRQDSPFVNLFETERIEMPLFVIENEIKIRNYLSVRLVSRAMHVLSPSLQGSPIYSKL